jgi:hypothetical protein
MRSHRRQRGSDVTLPNPGGEWRLFGPPAAPRLDAGDVIAVADTVPDPAADVGGRGC